MKIAFVDIDGTVLDYSRGMNQPTETCLEAFRRYREQGNLLIIATSRTHLVDGLDTSMFDGFVFSNGQYIEYQGKILKNNIFSKDQILLQQAIYSKYKIIDEGEIEFPNSSNNVIFADIVKGKDTIRVYSMHLQSIKISTDIHEKIDEEKSKFIFKRLSEAFTVQQQQAELIKKHFEDCKFSKIICGDLNNSAFSYVYRTIKGDMKDAFEQAGTGFGKSYNYKYYPARIDYVFVEENIEVKEFKSIETFQQSDHFPQITRLKIEEKE